MQISLWFCPGFCMHLKSIKLDPALTLELMNFDAGYSYLNNLIDMKYTRKFWRHLIPLFCPVYLLEYNCLLLRFEHYAPSTTPF